MRREHLVQIHHRVAGFVSAAICPCLDEMDSRRMGPMEFTARREQRKDLFDATLP